MRHLTIALTVLLGVSACSGDPVAQPAPTTTTSAVTSPTTTSEPAPTTSSAAPTSSAAAAAVVDPFTEYAKLVGPLEPTLTKAQLREKYDTAVKMFCPGGRPQMENLKKLASNPAGATAEKTAAANKKAATSIGALWQYGCGKGRDEALYTPAKPAAQGKASWPCEPGYPNCTKADSERYQAQLEYKRQQEASAKRDARGETKEEYCKRTGQPLATCQAG